MKIEDIIRSAIKRNVEAIDNMFEDDLYPNGIKLIGIEAAVTQLTDEFNKLLTSAKRSACKTCKYRPPSKSKVKQAEKWAEFLKTIND
jgi:hypothetical protein